MAGSKKNIKGLIVEIGGDTTKLGKALEGVNKKSAELSSELGQVNRLLKMDPGNTDLLAQKQEILAEAVENTAKKLATLKAAEEQVQAQFRRGEVSEEQVRALKREVEAAAQKLEGYKTAAKETAEEIAGLGDKSRAAKNAAEGLGDALDGVANTGLATLTGLVTAAATALAAAAESTREYRREMGKLDTAFEDNGHSGEAALQTYREIQGVLGESDQAVEAANHLAALTEAEEDLAYWTGDILPGVYARWGASLPLENLTEAANLAVKNGEVSSGLADALDWAGVSSADFAEELEKCNTEQERQALIQETLVGLYGEASAAYKENNADIIAANQANDQWIASLAQVGATVEPLLTQIKSTGAELMTNLVPVIQILLDNLPAVAVALGGITAALLSYKVAAIAATAAEQGLTLAQYAAAAAQKALNVAMSANPVGLVILGITALVTAFTYLWNNCEGFRQFWLDLWEKIKAAALQVAEELKVLPEKIYTAISGAINRVKEWGASMVSKAKTAAADLVSKVTSGLKALPGKVWSTISGAVQRVVKWGSDMASKAKAGMKNVISGVTSTLKSLPTKVLSIGKDLVSGLWNGINDKLGWLKNKIKSFTNSVLDGIKKFFGVHSPARSTGSLRTTDWVGEMLNAGLAGGLLDSADTPINAMRTVTGGVLDAAKNIDGLSVERGLQYRSTANRAAAAASSGGGMLAKLDAILGAIERGQVLTIDGRQLIGATADGYDNALGYRRALAARGAL